VYTKKNTWDSYHGVSWGTALHAHFVNGDLFVKKAHGSLEGGID
jgi:hypothetical protein